MSMVKNVSFFLKVQKDLFSLSNIVQQHIQANSTEHHTCKKFQIFEQNRGLTPLEKCKFFDFFKMTSL